jgi:hypothetical protein
MLDNYTWELYVQNNPKLKCRWVKHEFKFWKNFKIDIYGA